MDGNLQRVFLRQGEYLYYRLWYDTDCWTHRPVTIYPDALCQRFVCDLITSNVSAKSALWPLIRR